LVKVPIDADLYHRLEKIIEGNRKRREEHTKELCWECLRLKQSIRWIPFCSKKCSQTFWDRSQRQDEDTILKPRQRKSVSV